MKQPTIKKPNETCAVCGNDFLSLCPGNLVFYLCSPKCVAKHMKGQKFGDGLDEFIKTNDL